MKINHLWRISAVLVVGMVMVSCWDEYDPDPNKNTSGGGEKKQSGNIVPAITGTDGVAYQLLRFDGDTNYPWYEYDEKGNLVRLGDGDFVLDVSGKTVKTKDRTDEDYTHTYQVTTNNKGYITGTSLNVNIVDSDGSETYSGKATFTYNNKDQFIGYEWSVSGFYTEDGEKVPISASVKKTFIWENDNLVKTEWTEAASEYGETYTERGSSTITYGSQVNPCRQVPASFIRIFGDGWWEGFWHLAPLGLFGVGPANLPNYVNGNPVSYTLNTNGTIATENSLRYVYNAATEEVSNTGGNDDSDKEGENGNENDNNGNNNEEGEQVGPTDDFVDNAPAGVEAIDLGLPSDTLWANCNVGATSPYVNGNYYAWGEVTTKRLYSWNTYNWGKYEALTKYCTDAKWGTVDNKSELDPSDDAAYVNWGSAWRIPSRMQLWELMTKCTWSESTYGWSIKGPNGNSIYLSKSGFHAVSSSGKDMPVGVEENGYYWSRTLSSDNCDAYYLSTSMMNTTNHSVSLGSRANGMPIRPVRNRP